MADPFATGLGTLFAGPRAVAAVYVFADGTTRPISVIPRLRMETDGTVRPRPVSNGKTFDIQARDIKEPIVGDTLIVGDDVYVLALPPEGDSHGLSWICDVPLLDHDVLVQVSGPTKDRYGDARPGFTDAGTFSAARIDLAGAETDDVGADQLVAWQTVRFFFPWSPAIAALTPRDRLVDHGQQFDVRAIAELGKRAAIEVTAQARVD